VNDTPTGPPEPITMNNLVKKDQSITFPAFNPVVGSQTLQATSTSGLPVSYTITNKSPAGIATLQRSTLLITGVGTFTITAKQAGNRVYNAAPAESRNVVVPKLQPVITFKPQPAVIDFPSDPLSISATSTNAGTPITYRLTEGATLATLSTTNVLQFRTFGRVIITASQAANSIYNEASATQTIEARKKILTITSITCRKGFTPDTFAFTTENSFGQKKKCIFSIYGGDGKGYIINDIDYRGLSLDALLIVNVIGGFEIAVNLEIDGQRSPEISALLTVRNFENNKGGFDFVTSL
jgi:hypothetical protein